MLPPSYRKLYGNVQAIKAYEAEVVVAVRDVDRDGNGDGDVDGDVDEVVCQVTAGSELHV